VYLVVQQKLLVLDVVATVVSTPLSNPVEPLDPATATFNVTVTTRVNLTTAGVVSLNITGGCASKRSH
jgi:adenosylcobinamide amidohydrolase